MNQNKRTRKENALKRLQSQLVSKDKTGKDSKKIPLTKKDTQRINSEIKSIQSKLN